MIQREQKQWRTEHPHVSVQTVYTDGHVPFGQLILINYLNSAFYTCEKKRKKKLVLEQTRKATSHKTMKQQNNNLSSKNSIGRTW